MQQKESCLKNKQNGLIIKQKKWDSMNVGIQIVLTFSVIFITVFIAVAALVLRSFYDWIMNKIEKQQAVFFKELFKELKERQEAHKKELMTLHQKQKELMVELLKKIAEKIKK